MVRNAVTPTRIAFGSHLSPHAKRSMSDPSRWIEQISSQDRPQINVLDSTEDYSAKCPESCTCTTS
ncbi:hypothetical protein PAXRUDRAFT_826842, partial [Paxillus rubicundulus Ve08.2h10]